jgi:hypothetical protein
MTTFILRGGIASLALSAVLAVPADAAITQISTEPIADASSDGSRVLFADGSVLNRSTGATELGPSKAPTIDLASGSATTLTLDNSALFVRTPAQPDGTFVSIGTQGVSVPAAKGILVRDGRAVVFQTTESPSRILLRDLQAGTTTELLGRAALLDASEDGQLITWLRQVEAKPRTAGQPLDSDPGTATGRGQAVGYTLGGASRIVAKTKLTQRIVGEAPATGCPTVTELDRTTPTNLRISQDGAGKYALFLSTAYQRGGGYPFASGTDGHLTPTGALAESTSNGQTTSTFTRVDPESGAWTSVLSDRANGAPLVNRVQLNAPSGQAFSFLNVGQTGTTDPVGAYDTVIPVNRGAAAIYNFRARSVNAPSDAGSFIRDGFTPGTDATQWLTLPRAVDAPNDAGATVDADYLVCGAPAGPVAGTFNDYVQAGSRIAWLGLNFAPEGKLAVSSARIELRWYGLTIWTRTVSRSGYVSLPKLPSYVPGFKVTTTLKLADGTRIVESLPVSPTGR